MAPHPPNSNGGGSPLWLLPPPHGTVGWRHRLNLLGVIKGETIAANYHNRTVWQLGQQDPGHIHGNLEILLPLTVTCQIDLVILTMNKEYIVRRLRLFPINFAPI